MQWRKRANLYTTGILNITQSVNEQKKILEIATDTIVIAGVTYYLLSDKRNFVRADIHENSMNQTIEVLSAHKNLHSSVGITKPIQFLLRVGYLKIYL